MQDRSVAIRLRLASVLLLLVGGCQPYRLDSYSTRAVYFDPGRFRTTAECLTAAALAGLPLDLCTMEARS